MTLDTEQQPEFYYTFSVEYDNGDYIDRVCGEDGCCNFVTMADVGLGIALFCADVEQPGAIKIEIAVHQWGPPEVPQYQEPYPDLCPMAAEWGEGVYNQ